MTAPAPVSPAVSAKDRLASETWRLMLDFFFSKARPRMLAIGREFDLMPPHQMVVGLLDVPRPMGELAQHMHCDNSNITGIVDRLSDRGLVERRPAERDRRVKLVALTEEGEALRAEIERRRAVPPTELAGLDAADLRQLREIFRGALDG